MISHVLAPANLLRLFLLSGLLVASTMLALALAQRATRPAGPQPGPAPERLRRGRPRRPRQPPQGPAAKAPR